MPSLVSQSSDDTLVIYFTDARILDETHINQIGKELIELLDKTDEGNVLLNFHQVRFMSSAMLGKLVQFHKKCKEYKTKLKMCDISSDIMEVFKLTRLNKLFDIYHDEEKAKKAFSKRGFFS